MELGCKNVKIGKDEILVYKGCYYKVSYISHFKGYLIESAYTLREAENNCYEDDDIYPIEWGEEKILQQLRNDLPLMYLKEDGAAALSSDSQPINGETILSSNLQPRPPQGFPH